MDRQVSKRIAENTVKHRRQKLWHKAVSGMAAVVVFCTTYALILPAITMENVSCPLDEHTHTASCYIPFVETTHLALECTPEVHSHTDACYDEAGDLQCGYADYLIHGHNEFCYDESGALVCTLPEIELHRHDDSCYRTEDVDVGSPDAPAEPETPETPAEPDGSEPETPDAPAEPDVSEPEPSEGTQITISTGEQATAKLFAPPPLSIQLGASSSEDEPAQEDTPAAEPEAPAEPDVSEPETPDTPAEPETPAPPAAESEPVLVCSEEELELHTHGDACWDETGTLVCGQIELRSHIHTEDCCSTVVSTPDLETLTCELEESEEHTHDETCYSDWMLNCGTVEHIHGDTCARVGLTEEELRVVDEMIAMIDQLPSVDEIQMQMELLMDDEDALNNYYLELRDAALPIYVHYIELDVHVQEAITNSDALLALQSLWSAMPLAESTTLTITGINEFSWTENLTVLYHHTSGRTLEAALKWWTVVVAEPINGNYVVQKIYAPDGSDKTNVSIPANAVAIAYSSEYVGAVTVDKGYVVTMSNNNWKTNSKHSYSSNGYCTVTFTANAGQLKPTKDNSSKLETLPSIPTRDYITLNLYNYGNNINTPYNNSNKVLPGFQQEYGTRHSTMTSLTEGAFNFGNDVTADILAGINGVTNKGGDINATAGSYSGSGATNPGNDYGVVNIPISGALKNTLVNGYPALSDGTSLSYLFGGQYAGTTYATKQNDINIDGLFQFDEETGGYFYNSRWTHAQFDSDSDTFTLYKQMISPNVMMYPFGNFMPFNDIVHGSKQASQIDKNYLLEIVESAKFKSNRGDSQADWDEYGTLASRLGSFISLMDAKKANWRMYDATAAYFDASAEAKKDADRFGSIIFNADTTYTSEYTTDVGVKTTESLKLFDYLYNIDYDDPSDFYFGMEMSMNLMQPKDGVTGLKGDTPMHFYFTGDDDVWVYIDGRLVLDLSGIHRHVGGAIDFQRGTVLYFPLSVEKGDVGNTLADAYRVEYFEDIFKDSGVKLVKNGLKRADGSDAQTFENYSEHEFKFYYMERGSGSSVCRLNFNFPILRKNNITVGKELSVDDVNVKPLLGNPDYYFQVMDATDANTRTDQSLIGKDVVYDILDEHGNKLGTGTTGENGVFTLKANQFAVFGAMENAGYYYVRELFPEDAQKIWSQYGQVVVNGDVIQENAYTGVQIGSESFKGADGPIQNISTGNTVFKFVNTLVTNKLGSLSIEKEIQDYQAPAVALMSLEDPKFKFQVTLDGEPIPDGTPYYVTGAKIDGQLTRYATTLEIGGTSYSGIIELDHGEKALIPNIIAGSKFTVQEIGAVGYTALYSVNGGAQTPNPPSGSIPSAKDTPVPVAIHVLNTEGGNYVDIPGKKTISNSDGKDRTFQFELTEVVSATDMTPVANGVVQTANVTYPSSSGFFFRIPLAAPDFTVGDTLRYYKITEKNVGDPLVSYDPSVYVAEVKVTKEADGTLTASLSKFWKDGTETAAPFSADFTNALLTTLTIEKVVTGVAPADQAYGFTVQLTENGTPLSGTYKATLNDAPTTDVTFDATGKATIQLKGGEKLKVIGLPQNAVWTVTETTTDGFQVSYAIDGASAPTSGYSASGTLASLDGSAVVFTNHASVELPQTGGPGTTLYMFSGMSLMLFACLLMYKVYFPRRKEAR